MKVRIAWAFGLVPVDDWHVRFQGARVKDAVHDRPGHRRHEYALSDRQRVECSSGHAH